MNARSVTSANLDFVRFEGVVVDEQLDDVLFLPVGRRVEVVQDFSGRLNSIFGGHFR